MSVKTALLLLNLGGPKTVSEVEPFLVNMFSDKTFINIPFNLGPKIARLRSKKVSVQYSKIGGSPLSKWTEVQGKELVSMLDTLLPSSAPFKFYPCFRYSSPTISEVKSELMIDKPGKIIAFTQYPHYSCATTGNSLRNVLEHLDSSFKLTQISKYSTHPSYINAWVELIKSHFSSFDLRKLNIVFTAHSIPASVAWRGDMYPYEIGSTVTAVMRHFEGIPYHLFWQSKVGLQEWLKPNTRDGLLRLAESGVKDVILVPIAFMQDHLETLYELDLEYVKEAKEKGMNVVRCAAPNDNKLFIKAMADIVIEHITENKHSLVHKCVNCPYPVQCKELDRLKLDNQGV